MPEVARVRYTGTMKSTRPAPYALFVRDGVPARFLPRPAGNFRETFDEVNDIIKRYATAGFKVGFPRNDKTTWYIMVESVDGDNVVLPTEKQAYGSALYIWDHDSAVDTDALPPVYYHLFDPNNLVHQVLFADAIPYEAQEVFGDLVLPENQFFYGEDLVPR